MTPSTLGVLLALAGDPQSAASDRPSLLTQAEAALAEGREEEAARVASTLADRFPSSARALLLLARAQVARKDTRGAADSLQRALALAPNSEEALFASAQLSLGLRAPLAAVRALEPLTRMCAMVAQYHYLLGVALMQAGDMAAAVDALREARRLDPDRPLTLTALGLALNNRKAFEEARTHLARALELEPDSLEATAALAESEEGAGDLARAEEHARRALARAGDHATANLVLGMVRMKQERYEEARASLEQAVATDPGSPKARYLLSLACARAGDEEAAQRHLAAYREKLKEVDERVEQLRRETGYPGGGGPP